MKKRNLLAILSMPFRYSPISAVIGIIYTIISALTPAAKTLATALFIDTAISIVRDGKDQSLIIMPILFLTALIAYDWIAPNAHNLNAKHIELKLRQNLRVELVRKRALLEYRHIEDSDSWDLTTRVCGEPEVKVKDAYLNTLLALQFVISTAGIMAILMTYAWWVGILLVACCTPIFYLSLKSGKKQYDAEKEASKFDRRHKYLFGVLSSREYSDERALFGYTDKLINTYSEFYDKARKIRVRMYMKWMSRSKAPAVLIGIVMTGILFALLLPVIEGSMSPGIYIALVGAVNTMTYQFSWQLSSITDSLAKANEYMKDYFEFLSLSETENADAKPAWGVSFDTLEFRNVTFSYPGIETKILSNLSFIIENGKHYAFVGANGAGKTTITKLICGLYDNYEGSILVDGVDIKSFSQEKRKALVSCVFQDFARYQISIYDNVAMGCIEADSSDERVLRSAKATMLTDVSASLPEGLHTKLGKIYDDGVDISGGQWQRIALARATASPAPLRILDEPTAALDPIAESEVYAQFEQLSRGVTTIFISHRLASAKLADWIYVIDDGTVVETGCHEELMALEGLYASMFDSQRGWYV